MKARLETAFRTLPRSDIGPQDVLRLEGAPRKKLAALLDEWRRFTDAGLETLEALAGAAAPNRKAMRFQQSEYYQTGIAQLSALTYASPEIGFIAVGDDKSSIWSVKPRNNGRVDTDRLRKNDGKLKGMEGADFNPDTGTLRVVTEETRKVFELGLVEEDGELKLTKPDKLGEIRRTGKHLNSGVEGLATLRKAVSGFADDYQLAVNEKDPTQLLLVDPRTLKVVGEADVPKSLKDVLPDLSDVAVSSKGTIFLLSDRGDAFVEFALRKIDSTLGGQLVTKWALVPLATTHIDLDELPLDGADRLQAEGLSFDHRGDLWVGCEANGIMIRFAQQQEG